MNETVKNQDRGPAPWLYLFGVLAWTWFFLGLAALNGKPLFAFPNLILAALGGLGPLIVAGILITLGYWDPQLDRSAWAFYRRSLSPRTLSWRWTLIIVGMVLF
ncbi:MAG: hypothetical protein ACNA70_08900, partial [Brevefilum sp.]